MSHSSSTAPLKLRVVVIGGSLGGLACAHALSKAGHYVHVIEKADGHQQNASGIRIPPNLARILFQWGLEQEFIAAAIKCDRLAFRNFDGELVGMLEYKEEVMKVLEADFWLMHYSDLMAMMYKLAIDAGAVFQPSTTVTSIDPELPSVNLSTGETINCDLIVGADGYNGIARRAIEEANGQDSSGKPSGTVVYTVCVPTDGLEKDADLWEQVRRPEWAAYMGDRHSILAHPMRDFKEYSLSIFYPDPVDSEESWTREVSTDCINMDNFGPFLTALMSKTKTALETKYIEHTLIEDWIHPSGKVVLLGEAAHPQIPSSSHSGSLAVEDAAILGELFSRLCTRQQIQVFLVAYQELREKRCWNIQQTEASNNAYIMLPRGPGQEARDVSMRLAAAHGSGGWDEAMHRSLWEEIHGKFLYDPCEVVGEWWHEWWLLRECAALTASMAQEKAEARERRAAEVARAASLQFTIIRRLIRARD